MLIYYYFVDRAKIVLNVYQKNIAMKVMRRDAT